MTIASSPLLPKLVQSNCWTMLHPNGEVFEPLHSGSPGFALHRPFVMRPLTLYPFEIIPIISRWGLALLDYIYIACHVFQLASVRGQEIINKPPEYCSTEMPTGYGVIHSGDRQVLYDSAFRPVNKNTGSYYDCSQHTIDRATHPHGRHTGQYVSRRRAVHEIVAHNAVTRPLSRRERHAMHRLRQARNLCHTRTWGADLVIKAFLDLDVIFFCSRLRDMVKVKWKRIPRGRDGKRVAGLCGADDSDPTSGRREIWLNAGSILRPRQRRPFQEMWTTILHEMW